MAKSVRLSDIAQRVNVSTVTVSKALSGQKGVSEEMRQRIIQVADELGYTKKNTANTEHKSHTIGVIVAERFMQNANTFYWKLYQELSQKAMLRNCFSIIELVAHEEENTGVIPRIIQEKRAEGLIILGSFKREYVLRLVNGLDVPYLHLDSRPEAENGDSVVSNNLMGAYSMTNYLFKMGHRDIGFVGTRLCTSSIDDRFLGYYKSMMEHGESLREEWILNDRDREFGKMDMERQFILPQKLPTAFFCNCDAAALYLICKLNRAGYRVPEDVSVAGFDHYVSVSDSYLTEKLSDIRLTTYEINLKEMAGRALHIILHKMDNSRYSSGMIVLPGKLIVGNSVKKVGDEILQV